MHKCKFISRPPLKILCIIIIITEKEDLIRLNILRGTIITFFTSQKYDEHLWDADQASDRSTLLSIWVR